jgi:hypothetical protein
VGCVDGAVSVGAARAQGATFAAYGEGTIDGFGCDLGVAAFISPTDGVGLDAYTRSQLIGGEAAMIVRGRVRHLDNASPLDAVRDSLQGSQRGTIFRSFQTFLESRHGLPFARWMQQQPEHDDLINALVNIPGFPHLAPTLIELEDHDERDRGRLIESARGSGQRVSHMLYWRDSPFDPQSLVAQIGVRANNGAAHILSAITAYAAGPGTEAVRAFVFDDNGGDPIRHELETPAFADLRRTLGDGNEHPHEPLL